MSTSSNSALWQVMAQLDAGIEQSKKREAEKGVVYREHEVYDEPEYRLPLRVAQELSGSPVGFECPKPMTPP